MTPPPSPARTSASAPSLNEPTAPPVAHQVASRVASPGTRRALELADLLELVAHFAATDRGATRVRQLEPTHDDGLLQDRREDYGEIALAISAAGALVPSEEEPLAPWLEMLQSPVSALSSRDLVSVARLLESIEHARLSLDDRDRYPRWWQRFRRLLGGDGDEDRDHPEPRESQLPWRALAGAIRSVLDDRGIVRDDASPALRRLIGKARSKRESLRDGFGRYVEQHRSQLGDETVTQRDGRYAVLLPSGHRGRLPGLVQGRSATGRSFYFEPIELVEANNEMAAAGAAIEEEKARLLRELDVAVHEQRELITRCVELIVAIDAHQAASGFARIAGASLPEIGEGAPRIVAGRHPLIDPQLAQARRSALGEAGNVGPVVPLDLDFADHRMLVVTGPNAGGKTVALKTLGLFSLMALCGLPLPAAPSTRLPPFECVVALVGDEQDLLTDRSTFSARLMRLAEAWEAAKPGSLILLDEIGSGTNPQEGAALGVTLLEELVDSGALGVFTTHLVEIASAAMTLPAARSMAMEFDAERGAPTFHLEDGPPAASEALGLARRLGLPARWLDRAERRLGPEQRDLRALLAETDRLRRELRDDRAAIASLRSELEDKNERLERELASARDERKRLSRRVESDIAEFRRQVRSQLESEVARISSELASGRKKRVAQRGVERLFEQAPKVAAPEPVSEEPAGEVEVGGSVRHRTLGWRGVVERLDGNRAVVGVSGKRVRCRRSELVRDGDANRNAGPSKRAGRTWATGGARGAGSDSDSSGSDSQVGMEINLIGVRVEPALERLDEYLDRALLSNHGRLRVIHGHGTGRLRRALRRHLNDHPAVESASAAGPAEGGDGATIVILR